jgi:hypothetical protein
MQAQIILFCAAVDSACYRLSRLQAHIIMFCAAVDSACYRLSRLQAQNIMYCAAVDSAFYSLHAGSDHFVLCSKALLAIGSVGCRRRILCIMQQ